MTAPVAHASRQRGGAAAPEALSVDVPLAGSLVDTLLPPPETPSKTTRSG